MPEKQLFNKKIIILINLFLLQALVVAANNMITGDALGKFAQIPMRYISGATWLVSGLTVIGTTVMLVEIFRMSSKEREAEVSALRLEENQQMLEVLRSQRHDFVNHIQVIHGMAQMGLRDNLASYVNELGGGIEMESRLSEWAPLEVAAFLIKKSSFVKTLGIKLDIEIEANVGRIIIPPPEMVRVVGNLVNNAVYSLVQSGRPDKRILVKLTEERDTHKILICDNGLGIPDDIKKQIFARGFTTKGADGSGLGLDITGSLVEKYGGEIYLIDQPGFSTCFAIILPKESQPSIKKLEVLTQR